MCVTETAHPDDPYSYYSAVIDCLSAAAEALQESADSMGAKSTAITEAVETVVIFKRASGDYKCASEKLKPYTASENLFIRASAASLISTLQMQVLLIEKNLVLLDRLNEVDKTLTRNELIHEISDFEVNQGKLWELFVQQMPFASYGLVAFSADQKSSPNRLLITKGQRAALLKKLEAAFPVVAYEKRRTDETGSVSYVDASAILLYDFFETPFKTTDE